MEWVKLVVFWLWYCILRGEGLEIIKWYIIIMELLSRLMCVVVMWLKYLVMVGNNYEEVNNNVIGSVRKMFDEDDWLELWGVGYCL